MSLEAASRAGAAAHGGTRRRGGGLRALAVRPGRLAGVLGACLFLSAAAAQQAPIVVGSKNFTESYLLGEIMAQLLESQGRPVTRRFGFGGTLVTFEALDAGEIDVYPEYTGTISETVLTGRPAYGSAEFAAELDALGLRTLDPLGFDNTYALAVAPGTAARLELARISDLASHPELEFGLSHEFRDRPDGWPGLRQAYSLPQGSIGIEHGLAYRALLEGDIDVTDAYSTDGDLVRYELVVLEDDRAYFPDYLALPLVNAGVDADAAAILNRLGGRLDEQRMRDLNAAVAVDGRTFADVAAEFLREAGFVAQGAAPRGQRLWAALYRNTLTHLQLTSIALALACVTGIGLALAVYRSRALSNAVLYTAGLLQTIPSIALLALLIPIAGVGRLPAIIALFLYSMLPIVRNTVTALTTIDPLLRRVAAGIGLTQAQQLRHVYVPLALPHMLSGLRIAAVVSIGTATLAAFVGAGGLGEPIVTGLALNDTALILQGAVPAALLAVATELAFELAERRLVPPHLATRRAA